MVKKYIISCDTNIRIGNLNDEYRHFMFKKDKMYNTIEEAEAALIKKEKKIYDESKFNQPVYFTIIPIYIKNKYLPISNLSDVSTNNLIDSDINAIKLYLELGYSVADAQKAFYKVFGNKNNADNKKRYKVLSKFIKDYEKKQLKIKNKTK